MAMRTPRRTGPDLLGVYLNDHLAGATVGVELSRRMTASAGPQSAVAGTLRKLAAELSSLEETEILRLGVEGKAAGWRTLRILAERDTRLDTSTLDELIARAARQSAVLEDLRTDVAEQLLAENAG
jgi:hypothetical protein